MDAPTRRISGCRVRRLGAAGMLIAGSVLMLTSPSLAAGSKGGPGGNNGTIKIDGVALQGGQGNEPHVDCQFALEFSGYDQGDLNATVSFELQAPTRRPSGSQVLVTDTIPIGEDPAGGATDLDASRLYTLDFTGVPAHPQQGYHVKVTIHADGSRGADVKHKVFWVQPCAAPTTTTTATTTTTTATTTTVTTAAVLGATETAPPAETQVLAAQEVQPSTLPVTGSGTDRLVLLGLALALAGLALLTTLRPRPIRA